MRKNVDGKVLLGNCWWTFIDLPCNEVKMIYPGLPKRQGEGQDVIFQTYKTGTCFHGGVTSEFPRTTHDSVWGCDLGIPRYNIQQCWGGGELGISRDNIRQCLGV